MKRTEVLGSKAFSRRIRRPSIAPCNTGHEPLALTVQLLSALTTKGYDSIRDVNIFESPDQEVFRGRATGLVIQQPSQSIICQLSACVRTYPDRSWIKDRRGSQLTYRQLERRVSVLTTALLAHVIGTVIPVGILGLPTADYLVPSSLSGVLAEPMSLLMIVHPWITTPPSPITVDSRSA